MISLKMMTKILCENFENVFSNEKKDLPALPQCNSFNVWLNASEFFKKLKLPSPKRLVQFQLFEKLTCTNYSKLNLKPYNYLH